MLGTLRFVWYRFVNGKGRFTPEMVGMCLAHFGLAVFFFGVLMTESASRERDVAAKPGQSFELQRLQLPLRRRERHTGPELPGGSRNRRRHSQR